MKKYLKMIGYGFHFHAATSIKSSELCFNDIGNLLQPIILDSATRANRRSPFTGYSDILVNNADPKGLYQTLGVCRRASL